MAHHFRCAVHHPGVYAPSVRRALLTWSDAGILGPSPAHQGPRPASDRGPILRLLDQDESRYDALWILTIPAGEEPAQRLARAAQAAVSGVEVRVLEVDDPSDYKKLFGALGPVAAAARRAFPAEAWTLDVLLSAGTPQAQTLWVIMVQAGVLRARMLQIIPAVFVGEAHPRAVREVRLDIEASPRSAPSATRSCGSAPRPACAEPPWWARASPCASSGPASPAWPPPTSRR